MTQYFTHPQLTPNDTQLFLDEKKYTISLLQAGELVTCQQFTQGEWRLLRFFFRENRSSFSYEEGLSAYTGDPLDACHERFLEAKKHDEFYEDMKHSTVFALMKPVREVLIGCQERLHAVCLHCSSLLDFGYDIVPYRQKEV